MVFDSVVKFYKEDRRGNNPELLVEDMANVTDLGTDRSAQLLGNINQQALVVRTAHPITVTFSYLTINDGEKLYRLTTSRKPLKGNTLIVGEDIGY